MILITKLGHRVIPVRMGIPEHEGPTITITGVNIDSPDRDLFGKRLIEEFKISDFAGIVGSYAFPPVDRNGNMLK